MSVQFSYVALNAPLLCARCAQRVLPVWLSFQLRLFMFDSVLVFYFLLSSTWESVGEGFR